MKNEKLRINKKEKFANTNQEYADLLLNCYMNYIINDLKYDQKATRILKQLFKFNISDANSLLYINCTAQDIYQGIINDNLASYAKKGYNHKSIINVTL